MRPSNSYLHIKNPDSHEVCISHIAFIDRKSIGSGFLPKRFMIVSTMIGILILLNGIMNTQKPEIKVQPCIDGLIRINQDL